jgi:hypothetical protein
MEISSYLKCSNIRIKKKITFSLVLVWENIVTENLGNRIVGLDKLSHKKLDEYILDQLSIMVNGSIIKGQFIIFIHIPDYRPTIR